jgi:soluble P-type ATPase
MKFDIQNFGSFEIKNIVLDFNETIAKDGKIKEKIPFYLKKLSKEFEIYVITSDTNGSAAAELENLPVKLKILTSSNHTEEKATFVKELKNCFAIGNGNNDSLMLKEAVIGVCVIEDEGAASKSIINADIVTKSIYDAFELLLNPKRIIVTLRM